MRNIHIVAFAIIATFGVYAAGNNSLQIPVSENMMKAARNASENSAQFISPDENLSLKTKAADITSFSQSQEFKNKQNELKRQVFSAAGVNAPDDTESGPKLAGNQVVMFVSSSMPVQTLRNYARDLAKVGGVMVMRGTIGGISKMTETVSFTRQILVQHPECEGAKCKMWGTEMLIDPLLFRIYNINKVPALIYQPDMHIQSYCDGLENINKASAVIYGDASVRKMLESIALQSPTENKNAIAQAMEKLNVH